MRPSLLARTIALTFLIACAVLFLAPVAWMVLQSFKTQVDVIAQPPKIVFHPTLDNYVAVLGTGGNSTGNSNFGAEFGYAGDVVSRKCGVPYLYRFELMGTTDDVFAVRAGLADFWKDQTCHQPSLQNL